MYKTLYCHIGAGKTGTSSIQGTFFHNRSVLRASGVQSFRNPVQTVLAHIVDDTDKLIPLRGQPKQPKKWEKRFTNTRAQMLDASADPNLKTVFFSTEHCLSLDHGDIERLQAYFAELAETTKIIYYVRHPLSLIPSNIQQWIKTGHVRLPEDPTQMMPVFRSALKDWIAVFGKQHIVIRKFEPWNMPHESVVADICTVIGAPQAFESLKVQKVNESLTASATLIADKLNQDLHATGGRFAKRDYLFSIKGPKFGLEPHQLEAGRARIQANLDWLEKEFGVVMETPPPSEHTSDRNILFDDTVLQSIARLLNQQQLRIEALEAKLADVDADTD